MDVNGSKIKALIEHYGKQKNYEEKSYLVKFTGDYGLNYKQWSNYIRGNQAVGIKIVDFLIEVFPELNLNWLLKDEGEMFGKEKGPSKIEEPTEVYQRVIDNQTLWNKLEAMHADIRKILPSKS